MGVLSYPPIIENKLPAFVKTSVGITIQIPFKLSKAVSYSDFDSIELRLRTITSGLEKITASVAKSGISYNETIKYYNASFTLTATQASALVVGQFYKAQIAFKKGVIISPWSEIGIIKCTGPATMTIDNLDVSINNNNPVDFIGKYVNRDTTEKVYSYCFTIYDSSNQVYETSGELIHNNNSDEMKTVTDTTQTPAKECSEYYAYDRWSSKKGLQKGLLYTIVYAVTTINNYKIESSIYTLREGDTVDANIPALLLAEPDNDNGCVRLSLVKKPTDYNETQFSGNFVISRYSSNTQHWNEICRFNALSQTPSELGIIWTDFTIEHGVKYLYCVQAFNKNHLYSNRILHVLKNPYSKNQYISTNENGEPCYILADFEDAFLTDGDRQLKIKYNPKVSSFKSTILESKLDTLGSKYPFIFRNGNVNYKEFAISGMLSHLGDEKELFMSGLKNAYDNAERSRTAAIGQAPTYLRENNSIHTTTALTSDNFYRERQFKLEALDWLTNGKPKLFRSPGEGSYIVRLMNISLTPNDTLGRMLHTFSATAYEIAEYNFDNLETYNLLHIPEVENRVMKFTESTIGTKLEAEFPMYYAVITEASSGTEYNISFVGENAGAPQRITIGATGAYYFNPTVLPISKIEKISGDAYNTAKVTYGYYDRSVPDNFSYLAKVDSRDTVAQFIGTDENIEIISTYIEDIRTEVGNFYSLVIYPRNIVQVYTHDSNYYLDEAHETAITNWVDTTIYKVNTNDYYSGNPMNSSNYLGNTPPECAFKLNNKYILDLSTGNTIPEQTSDTFIALTQGTYRVSTDFGNITALHLTPGVYIEVAFETKEKTYSLESEDVTVKALKETWQTKKAGYEASPATATKAEVDSAYTAYIEALEEALEEAFSEEGNYAL